MTTIKIENPIFIDVPIHNQLFKKHIFVMIAILIHTVTLKLQVVRGNWWPFL